MNVFHDRTHAPVVDVSLFNSFWKPFSIQKILDRQFSTKVVGVRFLTNATHMDSETFQFDVQGHVVDVSHDVLLPVSKIFDVWQDTLSVQKCVQGIVNRWVELVQHDLNLDALELADFLSNLGVVVVDGAHWSLGNHVSGELHLDAFLLDQTHADK